jgi:hypothetical protein
VAMTLGTWTVAGRLAAGRGDSGSETAIGGMSGGANERI